MSLQDWASVSQIVQGFAVAIALAYAATQLREAISARHFTVINDIIEEISHEDVRSVRRWMLTSDVLVDGQPTEDDRRKVRRLAVAYDRVGFFVKNGLLPEPEAFYRWHGDEIERLWNRASSVIEDARRVEGRSKHCECFEFLGTTWIERMKRKVEQA